MAGAKSRDTGGLAPKDYPDPRRRLALVRRKGVPVQIQGRPHGFVSQTLLNNLRAAPRKSLSDACECRWCESYLVVAAKQWFEAAIRPGEITNRAVNASTDMYYANGVQVPSRKEPIERPCLHRIPRSNVGCPNGRNVSTMQTTPTRSTNGEIRSRSCNIFMP
jgi:hypothetical protein